MKHIAKIQFKLILIYIFKTIRIVLRMYNTKKEKDINTDYQIIFV